jgi:uncharacterized delta-60 repeat protein
MTDLDTTTFNTPNGFLTTGFNTLVPELLPQDTGVSVVIRSDNRIVMGGYSQYTSGSYITLSCYNTDGSLYTTFGTAGKVLLPAPAGFTGCTVNDVILQPNDYIIVTGDTSSVDPLFPPPVYPLRPSMFVARFTPLGVLDTMTFGGGLGYVIIPPSAFSPTPNPVPITFDQCYSNSVIIQPNGYIVLGGNVRRISPGPNNKSFIALVRLDTTGALDNPFGTNGNGTVYAGFTALNEDICNCLSIDSNSKIVSGGFNYPISTPIDQKLSVVRFTTTGILDTTFNNSGITPGWLIIPHFFLNSFDSSSGIGINSVGQIIISGYITKQPSSEKCFGVAAVTSNGILDTSFGTGGQTVLDLSPTYDLTGIAFSNGANALALQSDDKIVITGGFRYPPQILPVITQGFSLARFNTNGTLDLTFGLAGLGYILSDLVSSIIDNEIGYSVAIQSDGKVLVGGTVLNIEDSGANRYFILARYFGFPPYPPPTPIVPICFPAGTPVTTDQGEINIELIDPDVHTIFNKKIVAITETIMLENNIVCFEKNSLGYNIPNKKTYISNYHGIIYNGKLIQANKFVGRLPGVYYKKYNNEILYNVLMEKHYIIKINNMRVETLNPLNFVAQLYTKNYTPEEKTKLILEMNKKTAEFADIKYNTNHIRNIHYTKRNHNQKIIPNYFITQLHSKTIKNYHMVKTMNTAKPFIKLRSNTISHKPVIVKNIHHLSRSNKRLRR